MFTYLHYFALLGFVTVLTQGFNLDTRTVRVYSQTNRTGKDFFGFSVTLHSHKNTRWLIVGAPLSNVTATDGRVLPKYGAIFKCQTAGSKDCVVVNVDNTPEKTEYFPPGTFVKREAMETKSGQMLGATLTSRNGTVLVCAPRYTHMIDATSSRDSFAGPKLRPWLSGGCYLLKGDLNKVDDVLKPYKGSRSDFKANCQLGFSADMSQDRDVVMGKVGWSWYRTNVKQKSLYWSGGLERYSMITKKYEMSDRTQLGKFDYMGYDVASGHFSEGNNEGIAGGAPRGNSILGKVLVYDVNQDDGIVFQSQLELPKENQTGSYFGSTLCAVDLNNDGLTDLLVGAPLYADVMDEGRVFVYLNRKGALTLIKDFVLKGDNNQGARFGSAIANVGDLNRDGYQDVVIGAPYEGPNSGGAVYVYYGTKKGIEAKYRQKISAESIDSHLKGFGYSITGTVDVDNNAYPDVAVGSYLSSHAVLFRTRRIVEIAATITPDRTKIDIEKKREFVCVEKDGSVHKCLNVTVCFQFKDREPSNRQGLKISYRMEADADITTLELRRMYFHDVKHKNFTTGGQLTIPQQGRQYCLAPFTVHISDKYQSIDQLKPLTFDLSFSLDDKACLSVPDVPCPVLDAYRPTTMRKEVTFQKQCKNEVCKPDMSVTGRVRLPGNHQVLSVGSNGILTVDLDIENTAKDASYLSTVTLYFPTELSYIGPTSTKNVLCYSILDSNNTKAVCHIGNPFKAKTKKSLAIEFSAKEIASDFVITVKVDSASKDTNQDNNVLSLPVTTKYLTDMEITGISQPEKVIYNSKVVTKKNVKRETDIGPLILQSIIIKNHGPSFVEGVVVTVQVPQLLNKDDPDSVLLHLMEVELSGGPGKCNAVIHAFPIPGKNLTRPFKATRQTKPREDVKMECSSAVCYVFDCRLGLMSAGGSIKIRMTARLWKSTLITQVKTDLVTTARLTVPPEVMQSDTSNDDVKILLTARPSHYEDRKEEITWWIILVSVLGGLLLLALVIFIMYKLGFFRRHRHGDKDDALPEETKPMNV